MGSGLGAADEAAIAACSAVQALDALANYQFDPVRPLTETIDAFERLLPLSDRTRSNIVRALSRIDADRHSAFLASHRNEFTSFDPLGPTKYADFAFWALRNVLLAEWLGLDRSASLRILDIGMGSGSFAMVAESMGHAVVGTDMPNQWYEEICRLAGVRRIVAPVVAGQSYAIDEGPFDLITIMLPAFHRRSSPAGGREYWSVEDWAHLLRGLAADLLETDGRLFILMPLDKFADGTLRYSPLLRWALQHRAHLDRTLPGAPIRHILFERSALVA